MRGAAPPSHRLRAVAASPRAQRTAPRLRGAHNGRLAQLTNMPCPTDNSAPLRPFWDSFRFQREATPAPCRCRPSPSRRPLARRSCSSFCSRPFASGGPIEPPPPTVALPALAARPTRRWTRRPRRHLHPPSRPRARSAASSTSRPPRATSSRCASVTAARRR
eukprot:COSAG01_NODE_2898_length_6893_cov_45.927878_8_plen_163_part_00